MGDSLSAVSASEETEREAPSKDERIEACAKEVNAVLDKYNMILDPFFIMDSAGHHPMFRFVPKEKDDSSGADG